MKFLVVNICALQVALAVVKFDENSFVMENAITSFITKSRQVDVKFLTNSKNFELNHILKGLSTEKVLTVNVMNSTVQSKNQLVIIIVDTIVNLKNISLTTDYQVDNFYLIVSRDYDQQLIIDLFQNVWNSKQIININFMHPQHDIINLITFFPFHGHCGNSIKLHVVNNFTAASNWNCDDFFPIKLKNFNGCTLRLGTQPSFPAVERISHKNGTYEFIGSDIEISDVLSRKFNFTNIFVHNEWWGSVFENGSGDGTIGKLLTKDVDYICGWHFMNMLKSTFLDNSHPYFFVPFVIVVPPAAQYTSLENLIRCFQLSLWIASIGTCIFVLILIILLNHFNKNGNGKISYMIIVIIIFGGSTSRIPHENALRMMLMMFMLFCLVMRTAYLTEMFNFLQSGISKGVVESLDDMAQLQFSLHVPFFMKFFIPFDEIKYDKENIKVSQDTSVERFINLDSTFKGGFLEPLDSVIRGYGKSSTPLNILSQPLLTAPVAIYFQKNSFLRDTFSNAIQQMMEAGLIEYWINQKWTWKMKTHSVGGGEPKVLSLGHLSAAFIICMVGLFLSLFVFLIEKFNMLNPSFLWRKKEFKLREERISNRFNFIK